MFVDAWWEASRYLLGYYSPRFGVGQPPCAMTALYSANNTYNIYIYTYIYIYVCRDCGSFRCEWSNALARGVVFSF